MIAYRAMFSRRHHCIPTDLHLCVIKVHRVSFISRRILDTDAALCQSLSEILLRTGRELVTAHTWADDRIAVSLG